LKKAPKLFRQDCKISWSNDAQVVHNFIRGLSPYPGAYSILETNEGSKEVKIHKTRLTGMKSEGEPGQISIAQGRILAACNDEFIEIHTLQPPGKKSMLTSDFLRGTRSELIKFTSA
jgi:methionyl-tRNA formyltransferase